MPAKVKISGTYRNVPNADLFLKRNNNYDSPVLGGYVKVNSTYRQFHQGSDPRTYTFVASASKGARGTSWKTSGGQGGADYPQISRFSSAGNVYPWFGVIDFLGLAENSTYTLDYAMSVRPVVKSAYISMQRSNNGGTGSGYGQIYFGRYNGKSTDATPHHNNCWFDYYSKHSYSGSGSSAGTVAYNDNWLFRSEFLSPINNYQTIGVTLASQGLSHAQVLVNHFRTKAMAISATLETGNVSRTSNTYDPGYAGLGNASNSRRTCR